MTLSAASERRPGSGADEIYDRLRADLTAIHSYDYRPEPPLECPITVTGGASDPSVSPAQMLAWQAQTRRTALKHLVETFFDGSAEKVVAALLGGEGAPLSEEQLERMAELLFVTKSKGWRKALTGLRGSAILLVIAGCVIVLPIAQGAMYWKTFMQTRHTGAIS